jgi:hypothetical protein
MEAQQLKARAEEGAKRKLYSRRSVQTGGALTAEEALIKVKARRQKDAVAALAKADKGMHTN